MQLPPSVCASTFVCELVMTIARRGLMVEVMGQANAVIPVSMEGSFSSYVKIQ